MQVERINWQWNEGDIVPYVKLCIKRFSSTELRETLSLSADEFPLEANFQHLISRVGQSALPSGLRLSPEVGTVNPLCPHAASLLKIKTSVKVN
jgi:hypothetical protein